MSKKTLSGEQYNAQDLLNKYRLHDKDTASPFCLMITLTQRIKSLSQNHTSVHKKDHTAKRTIVRLVAMRKSVQRYMQNNNKYKGAYHNFMADLGLRA